MTIRGFKLLLACAGLVAAAAPARGQDIEPLYGKTTISGPGSRGAALLAALRFSSALSADSVEVAGCRVAKLLGEADYRAVVRPALGPRIVEPRPAAGREARCEAREFQEHGRVRVFLDRFVQVRRESNEVLPYPERLEFEVRIQVLHGAGYREWHEALVRPHGIEAMQDGNYRPTSWRVIRYEVAGWEYSDSRT